MSKKQLVELLAACKHDLLDIYRSAVASVKPEKLVEDSLSIDRNILVVNKTAANQAAHLALTNYDLTNCNIHVIGGGKCAMSMGIGLTRVFQKGAWNGNFSHGLLSVPFEILNDTNNHQAASELMRRLSVECLPGSRCNLPNVHSVATSDILMDKVRVACQHDKQGGRCSLFIVLISGGGSACLTNPKHISLDQKLHLISAFVQRGANIVDLNKIRRYFSNIKGGGLARHILEHNNDAKILTLILSDVIGDPIEFIASGPTYLAADRGDDGKSSMLDVFAKYDVELPEFETSDERVVANRELARANVSNVLVGNNQTALEAAQRRASELSYQTDILASGLSGDTHSIVDELRGHTFPPSSSRFLLIGGGEATVQKLEGETWGRGGRAQEMALDYMIAALSRQENDKNQLLDLFLAAGTDGQDGPTEFAGSFASKADWSIDEPFDLDQLMAAKKTHDACNFIQTHKSDWHMGDGLTGTNVMDLYFLLRVAM